MEPKDFLDDFSKLGDDELCRTDVLNKEPHKC